MRGNPGSHASIGVLYTGGTFGMRPSDRGYEPSMDLPERVDHALSGESLPAIRWLDPDVGPPVGSSDITPAFWYRLAATIRRHAESLDGFVIIHGTDTLAYTGSALSFLLAGLDRPVVVTGARAPFGESGSDALDNFRGALAAAASGHVEVTVAFNGLLLRANRSSKRFGTESHLFTAPHWPALATFTADGLHWNDNAAAPRWPRLPVARYQPGVQVALLCAYPGMDGNTVRALLGNGAAGLILEGYPSGIGPGGDGDFVAALAEADAAGIVLLGTSQAQYGTVRMGQYATSTPLAGAGLISGADLTREAALTKLHYLLCCDLDTGQRKALLHRNLQGELLS
ncbi:MAG: asparaginase [Ectothiorhodospiraceae bacterium]|nr:asparaginase [Ectothiorhodospiraceae bacterium]